MAGCVIITGASRGIGAAMARAFARAGYSVVAAYHSSKAQAEALAEDINQYAPGKVLPVRADITGTSDVDSLFAAAEQQFGHVNILVNNAGIAAQRLFCDISEREWDEMFAVHVKGTFLCCRRALPAMIHKKEGCIINVASMWGQAGASCESHYAAAKGAVIALTKSLAKEEGPSGIRVNCIAPGVVDTDMLAGLSPQDKAALCADTPLGRLGRPEDIASLAVYLASPEASFITGQVMGVNGGFLV